MALRSTICSNDAAARSFPGEKAMIQREISRRTVLGGAAVASVAASLKHAAADTATKDDAAIDVGVITEPTASHRTGCLDILA